MLTRLSAVLSAALLLSTAGAFVVPRAGSCTTGSMQCCDSTADPNSPAGGILLAFLGIPLDGVRGVLGLSCSPIRVIGVGGSDCKESPVCCENNSVGGLVSVGCVPVIP
ncbi:fungal hydrophobin [Fomes fomentarius]|nr:fungal hydrophobin [Fomes fomentarius]